MLNWKARSENFGLGWARWRCAWHVVLRPWSDKHWPTDMLAWVYGEERYDVGIHRCRCGKEYWRSPLLVKADDGEAKKMP